MARLHLITDAAAVAGRRKLVPPGRLLEAWPDLGERTVYEANRARRPIFVLRRPGGSAAHIWRLFRTRAEARFYMAESYARHARRS